MYTAEFSNHNSITGIQKPVLLYAALAFCCKQTFSVKCILFTDQNPCSPGNVCCWIYRQVHRSGVAFHQFVHEFVSRLLRPDKNMLSLQGLAVHCNHEAVGFIEEDGEIKQVSIMLSISGAAKLLTDVFLL